jgi:hypothetical protein
VQQVTPLVCALIASGRYRVEWHERDQFDGIDSDGERVNLVYTAVGLLRDVHASWDEKNPLCEDPAGGFYNPATRKKNGKARVSPRRRSSAQAPLDRLYAHRSLASIRLPLSLS